MFEGGNIPRMTSIRWWRILLIVEKELLEGEMSRATRNILGEQTSLTREGLHRRPSVKRSIPKPVISV